MFWPTKLCISECIILWVKTFPSCNIRNRHFNSVLESPGFCVQYKCFIVYLWTYNHMHQNITNFSSHHVVQMFESHTALMCMSVCTVAVLKHVLWTQSCVGQNRISHHVVEPKCVNSYCMSSQVFMCSLLFIACLSRLYRQWRNKNKVKWKSSKENNDDKDQEIWWRETEKQADEKVVEEEDGE
jgi:magnesium-transporting ATPase (P-type)